MWLRKFDEYCNIKALAHNYVPELDFGGVKAVSISWGFTAGKAIAGIDHTK